MSVMNKLYKGFMYFLTYVMVGLVGFALGLMTASIIVCCTIWITNFSSPYIFNYIFNHFNFLWFSSGGVCGLIYFIVIYRISKIK